MSKMKKAIEDMVELGWPVNEDSLKRLVKEREQASEDAADSIEFPDWFDAEIYKKGDMITNPFSKASIYIDRKALSMYDVIMGANVMENWDIVRKGCDWFRKHYPKEYMVLLD